MKELETQQLWKACYCGDVELLQQLIVHHGVEAQQRDRNGETLLHMASRSDSAEVVKQLLGLKLDPNTGNNNMQTPLHLAASKGYTDVVKVLMEGGCDLNRKTKFTEMTALHLASKNNQTDIVKQLLKGGAECCIPDTIGKPPAFYTSDPKIIHLFTKHAKYCSHRGTASPTDQPSLASRELLNRLADDFTARTDNSDNNDGGIKPAANPGPTAARSPSRRRKRSKSTSGKKRATLPRKEGKKRKGRKVKAKHRLSYSNQYKQRMELNVFDRLVGGSKKKVKVP